MKRICISKNWLLHAPGTDGFKNIDLPNDYSVTIPRSEYAMGGEANGFFQGGMGTYVKKLTFDAAPKHYILHIDGAYMCTEVKLNEDNLAMHPHGYAPFLVDLTDDIRREQTNTLIITTNGLQNSTRWYSGAGIYRDVFLWEGGDIRIEPWDLFITTPSLNKVNALYEISSDRNAEALLVTEIFDADGKCIAKEETHFSARSHEKSRIRVEFSLNEATPWDIDAPYLYTMKSQIIENEVVSDTDISKFGIRTVSADAQNGLKINGVTRKLRGGCIHHDHGVLGAADYPAACRRKLTKLKQAGFNALRIAHNPPSEQLLEMCDEMGIVVMDEAFDCWCEPKTQFFNYDKWFEEWWERDISAMVLRDRRHPSVISYSTGNEVPESAGYSNGDEWSARLCAKVRRLDPTRLVSVSTWEIDGSETWADRTAAFFAPYDICGYNYIYTRYELDHELYPKRVIWGSETHAVNFYESWNTTLRCNHVIGDFTWTAYDNMGEIAMGRCWWNEDTFSKSNDNHYPWRSCWQGDIDLCGFRRPQSYFREAVWLGNAEPRIFTTHPMHNGEKFAGTGWHWYDVHDTWTFADEYIGTPVKCEVYTDADEIEWLINGRSAGKSVPEKAIATKDIPYEKGELTAIAYKDGKECSRSSLHTVGEACAIIVNAESSRLKSDNRDLCYFDITIVDKEGRRVTQAKDKLTCRVENGELLGIFSADPCNDDQYGSNECHAYEGRAVAVVKSECGNCKLKLTVTSEKLSTGSDFAEVYCNAI